jgi:FOG: PKD repeat
MTFKITIVCCFAIWLAFTCNNCSAQFTIPWSPAVNITFGSGSSTIGPPLSNGSTSFKYTTDSCPAPGYYTVVNNQTCTNKANSKHNAGHLFYQSIPIEDKIGYMMLVATTPMTQPKILFSDTVKNLARDMNYLFWGGMQNVGKGVCYFPSFTFSVETVSGEVIQSYKTGPIGNGDSGTCYPGFPCPSGPGIPPPFNYYGGDFICPVGVDQVVLKIIQDPSTNYPQCLSYLTIDNIFLTPIGPNIKILGAKYPESGYVSTCFDGHNPVVIHGDIKGGDYQFGSKYYPRSGFNTPVFQWQRSIDEYALVWEDLPGQNSVELTQVFNKPDTFFIRLKVTDAANGDNPNGSVVSNVLTVEVNDFPPTGKFTSNSPVCTGNDLIFHLEGGVTYTVTGPNNFYEDVYYAHHYHPALADSGWYYTNITTLGGCMSADSCYVKIYGPDVKVSPGKSICSGESVQLTAIGGNKYEWSPPAGLSDPTIANPIATPQVKTRYVVKVMDETDCEGYGDVTISLRNELLKADFDGPSVLCPQDAVLFTDKSKGEIVNWKWDFGNGEISNAKDPIQPHYAIVNYVIDYNVRLMATDTSGCSDTATHVTKVAYNCYIAVPSGFTPNGDGLNDFLYPLNAYKATNLSFRVYNRDGQRVFETKDWTQKWDGNIKGIPQPVGVYVWILSYTDEFNRKISLKGTSALIR